MLPPAGEPPACIHRAYGFPCARRPLHKERFAGAYPGPLGLHPGAAALDINSRGLLLGGFLLRRNRRIGIARPELSGRKRYADAEIMFGLEGRLGFRVERPRRLFLTGRLPRGLVRQFCDLTTKRPASATIGVRLIDDIRGEVANLSSGSAATSEGSAM